MTLHSLPKIPTGGKTPNATAPAPADADPPSRKARIAFYCAMALSCAWVIFHAYATDRQLWRLSVTNDPSRGVESRYPLPPILRHMAYDGYLWNRHAYHLTEDGRWRLRHTTFDNAPEGRQVHWNSAFAWYLRILGQIRNAMVKEPLRTSIGRMSIWANPLLLLGFICWFGTLVHRRFGPIAGIVTVLSFVCSSTLYEGFYPAYPDHHGLISMMIFGTLFGIAWAGAGWVAPGSDPLPTDEATARRGMAISAWFGAAGFWISAISETLALIGIGLGALLAAGLFLRRAEEEQCVWRADLWRYWGRTGALATLLFYLLEYFPSWPVLRLEVNHPLFALAWWGGAECIAVFGEWLSIGRRRGLPIPWARSVPGLVAVSIIPLAVLLLGERVHAARGDFLAAIHTHISEFKPLLWRIGTGTMTWSAAFGPFPLFVLAALHLLCLPRLPAGRRLLLVFLLGPVAFITAMHFHQIRWGTLGGAGFILLGVLTIPPLWQLVSVAPSFRFLRWLDVAVVSVAFASGPYASVRDEIRSAFAPPNTLRANGQEALHLIMRDLAETIRRQAGDKPVTLLSSPNSSLLLGTMGDFKTIGTLYWENAEGLKAAARMFAAQSDEEALRLLKERGVTHIALISWENFIEPYVRIINPDGGDAAVLNSFGYKALFQRTLPVWCRPIPYPNTAALQQLQLVVLLLEVVPEQTPVEALFHVGIYHRVEGRPQEAEQCFRQILSASPDSNLARLELAGLLMDMNRAEEGVAEMIQGLAPVEAPVRDGLLAQAGLRLAQMHQPALALRLLEAFPLTFTPESANRANLMAWILSTAEDDKLRDPRKAMDLLHEIEKASLANRVPWGDTMAAALAAAGRYDEAVSTLERHIAALDPVKQTQALELLKKRLDRYRAQLPWIDAPPPR